MLNTGRLTTIHTPTILNPGNLYPLVCIADYITGLLDTTLEVGGVIICALEWDINHGQEIDGLEIPRMERMLTTTSQTGGIIYIKARLTTLTLP